MIPNLMVSSPNQAPGNEFPGMGIPAPAKAGVNWVRIVIGLILIGGTLFYFLGNDEKPSEKPGPKKAISPFERLKPEQQQYVKDTYRLADSLYREGRYEMARQEVIKIHQLIPSYEESQELERLATIGLQTQIDQREAERKEKEKAEIQEKVLAGVTKCRKLLGPLVEPKTIEDCLMPVMSLNPEDPAISGLRAEADKISTDRLARKQKQIEYQALVKRMQELFQKADSVSSKGTIDDTLEALQQVVDSKLPDPDNLKEKARVQIAKIRQQRTDKQAELEKAANEAAKAGNNKLAIETIKKALEINPENEVLRGRMASMLSELKKQMQNYYQEGVLEESVGEVETAKTKWKKIIELSLPDEDYYKKARIKLKKYGIE